MCGEPMHGVTFVVEEIVVVESTPSGDGGAESSETVAASQSQHGPLSGQIISTSQRACRSAFLAKKSSPRLVEPYYRCKLQCSGEQLGALYGVLARRRGVVVEEDLWEGTPIFSIVSLLPVRVVALSLSRSLALCARYFVCIRIRALHSRSLSR